MGSMPQLIDVVSAEINNAIATSLSLKKQIKESKTTIKREFYKKKLKKNNQDLIQMLFAFDKLEQQRKNVVSTKENTSND